MKIILLVLCFGTIPLIIHAQQPVVNPSSFTTTSVNDTVRFHVEFTGDSVAARHLWLFGDGRISTDDSPTHVYADCGKYEVKHFLLQLNKEGAIISSDSSLLTVWTACPMVCKTEPDFTWKQTQVNPLAQVTAGKSSVLFTNTTRGGVPKGAKIYWFVDGQLTSERYDPLIHFPYGGYFTVCLRITLLNGCVVERCERIGVAEY